MPGILNGAPFTPPRRINPLDACEALERPHIVNIWTAKRGGLRSKREQHDPLPRPLSQTGPTLYETKLTLKYANNLIPCCAAQYTVIPCCSAAAQNINVGYQPGSKLQQSTSRKGISRQCFFKRFVSNDRGLPKNDTVYIDMICAYCDETIPLKVSEARKNDTSPGHVN